MAEPAGAAVVFAVGATKVERCVGVGLGEAVAVAGFEPNAPKPLGFAWLVSLGLTFTAVFAGVGAGAAAGLALLEEPNEPNEPKPDDGLLGAGALYLDDWEGAVGAEGLE